MGPRLRSAVAEVALAERLSAAAADQVDSMSSKLCWWRYAGNTPTWTGYDVRAITGWYGDRCPPREGERRMRA